jgi:hypothetical protein
MDFPELETFALTEPAPGGGKTRSCWERAWATFTSWVDDGCRFCRGINAEYDEDHIFLVCMLYSGSVVQKCLAVGSRCFASDPVLVPNELLESARVSLAPEIDRRNFVPGHELERSPGCPGQATGEFNSDESDRDAQDSAFPYVSPLEPRL